MKGIVYEEMVHEGVNDFVHGGGRMQRRVSIPGAGLTVTAFEYNIIVNRSYFKEKAGQVPGITILGDVDIPDEYIPIFQKLLEVQEEANALSNLFCEIAESAPPKAA